MFEHISLGYSKKNIPTPSRREYEMLFMESAESVLRRVKWKAFHALNPGQESGIQSFGFNTTKAPPAVPQLKQFEYDLIGMLKKVKFVNKPNTFQKTLREDILKLKEGNKLIMSADKTSNLYKVEVEDYRKSIRNEITGAYKKVNRDQVDETNSEAANLVANLNIAERVDQFSENDAFITVKDTKEGFPGRVKYRTINPAKTSVGRISQQILSRVNQEVRSLPGLPQWTNTADAINWFSNIDNKQTKKFVKYDVVDFYPCLLYTSDAADE